ncbi:hypothetical protein EB57_00770 [Enterococcus faecalis]|uniref:P-loop NTPase fold protein n=1 Tax=Enterococcus faecalis TaxID=1351 RepID=UPI000CF31BB4|nr:P-loop NTPase fold protein [Enterococcus faecalis]PQH04039.1 hypothetical protein CUS09_00700 [Enterococcus faecalis]RBR90254.1 hypothetical protein EB57_00770 [Enterococcus faecalis]HAP3294660.1 hypothetical protein [Enterococcus faecalis]HBC1836162.1 hypothetical protein [Enterococcus faecalis]
MIDITAPFSYEQRDRFTFTESEKNIVKQLENLFKNGSGINVIYGNRGVGKTTLKNYAKHEVLEDNQVIVIDVPQYIEDAEFYSYILENLIIQMDIKIEKIIEVYRYPSYRAMQLNLDKKNELDQHELYRKFKYMKLQLPLSIEGISHGLKRELDIYNSKLNDLETKLESLFKTKLWKNKENDYENKKIQGKIEKYFEKILELKKWYQYERYLYNLLELQLIFDATVTSDKKFEQHISDEQEKKFDQGSIIQAGVTSPIVNTNLSSRQSETAILKSEVNYTGSRTITHNLTFQSKKKKLTNILKDLQNNLNLRINICIDELDKCSTTEVNDLINGNKAFFLESGLTTFLIMNLGNGITFKEVYSDYITSFILCKNLSIYEFLVKSANQDKAIYSDFFNLLNGYCSIQGNNRNLLVKDMTERSYELSESIVFIYLWQSNFYQKLPEDYQELFSIFFNTMIEHLKLLGELDKSDFKALILEFKDRYSIASVKLDLLFKQFEMSFFDNNLKQSSFFSKLWMNSYSKISEKLRFTSYEGIYFYSALENYFNDLVVKSQLLSVKDSKLILNYLSNFEIEEKFERLLELYGTTTNDFMNLFKEFSGMKNNFDLRRNVRRQIRYSNQTTYNEIDDAITTIDRWRNEIIGVVLFYPKDRKNDALINGVIYRYNNFGEVICIPYVGYIGLHSHKPRRIKEYKEFLSMNNVKFVEIEDLNEDIFQSAYKKSEQSEEEIIKNICIEYNYLNRWLELIPVDY